MTRELTGVHLVRVPHRVNIRLRFGTPAHVVQISHQTQLALFAPASRLCRVLWTGNAYGTTRWTLSILECQVPGAIVQTMHGVTPGASLLLHAKGARQVGIVEQLIRTIEARGVDPATVAAAYWTTVQNRLCARTDLPIVDIGRASSKTRGTCHEADIRGHGDGCSDRARRGERTVSPCRSVDLQRQ